MVMFTNIYTFINVTSLNIINPQEGEVGVSRKTGKNGAELFEELKRSQEVTDRTRTQALGENGLRVQWLGAGENTCGYC